MHDDDTLNTPNSDSLPEKYWTEEEWEVHLLDNEKVIDQYEKVFNENPERRWEDPTDLYYKVHYGIDLGEDFGPIEEDFSSDQEISEIETENILDGEEVSAGPALDFHDDLERIQAYQLAFQFSLAIYDFVKKAVDKTPEEDHLLKGLCFHALRIPANIAGGHGLGYEEDALCGNIVKNRWAFQHTEETEKLLKRFLMYGKSSQDFKNLLDQARTLKRELERRIIELRSKVWW